MPQPPQLALSDITLVHWPLHTGEPSLQAQLPALHD
jgi:hypothetical protein